MEANLTFNKTKSEDFSLEDIMRVSIPTFKKVNLNDILDFVSPEQLLDTLFKIKSKLLENGVISIHSYDLYELAYELVNDHFQTADFNLLIKDRKQILAVPDIVFLLKKLNFKILCKDIDSNRYYIEAQNV